jgi:hypothetical protein
VAASRTDHLVAAGESHVSALTGGYHLAFLLGAIFAATAAVLGATLLREPSPQAEAARAGEPAPAGAHD